MTDDVTTQAESIPPSTYIYPVMTDHIQCGFYTINYHTRGIHIDRQQNSRISLRAHSSVSQLKPNQKPSSELRITIIEISSRISQTGPSHTPLLDRLKTRSAQTFPPAVYILPLFSVSDFRHRNAHNRHQSVIILSVNHIICDVTSTGNITNVIIR